MMTNADLYRLFPNDPIVAQMREAARHPYIRRTPQGPATIDPVTVLLECPTCLPSAFGKAPLTDVLAADGTLRCGRCAAVLPILPEDLPGLMHLHQAMQGDDYETYLAAVCALNKKHTLPLLGDLSRLFGR